MKPDQPNLPNDEDVNTNSEPGSYHWFNTIVGFQKRVGEAISTRNDFPDNYIKNWGEKLVKNANALLTHYDKINSVRKEKIIMLERIHNYMRLNFEQSLKDYETTKSQTDFGATRTWQLAQIRIEEELDKLKGE